MENMNVDAALEEWNNRRRSLRETARDQLNENLYLWPLVKRIEIFYDGAGDSGSITGIEFFDENDKQIEVIQGDPLIDAVDNFTNFILPDSCFDNDGSFGTIYYQVDTGIGRMEHTWRTTEDETVEF